LSYARYKQEILSALEHASTAAHEGHVRYNNVPGYRPKVRKECDKPLCEAIRKAQTEARAI
jgi:hypothetical protein